MTTHTIPEHQWTDFCRRMSHDHLGWLATIRVLDREFGPQNIAMDLPFEGISFDTKGTRSSSLEISVGNNPSRHVSHVIDLPLHIRESEESNGSVDVQIEPARGPVTLIHLHARGN